MKNSIRFKGILQLVVQVLHYHDTIIILILKIPFKCPYYQLLHSVESKVFVLIICVHFCFFVTDNKFYFFIFLCFTEPEIYIGKPMFTKGAKLKERPNILCKKTCLQPWVAFVSSWRVFKVFYDNLIFSLTFMLTLITNELDL